MKKQYLKTTKTNENGTHIRNEVVYYLGGISYWDYKNYPRGYYANISCVELEDRGSYTMEKYIAGNCCNVLLKEVKRASAKAEAEADNLIETNENVKSAIKTLCAKNGIELI